MKHPKLLYGFMAGLGIVLLSIFFMIIADGAIYDYVWELFSPIQHLLTCFGWFCLLGGTLFLTVGIVGIGRQYIENSQNPFTRRRADSFTILAIILVPSIVFSLFLYLWLGALEVGF